MIRFNCHCTHEFLSPEDQAGGMVQCPKCGRLNDVPLLSDIANLDGDGLFKMDEGPKAPPKTRIAEATRVFTKNKQDDRGEDIDLRAGVDEFLSIGVKPVEDEPERPKYDPLTGELVEELEIKPRGGPAEIDPKKIPIAKRAVSYATADLDPRVSPMAILLALFQPVNLFVMLFIVIAHVVFQAVAGMVQAAFFFAAPMLIVVVGLIEAQYALIIEEIGAGDADELPRPLRNASVSEDMWYPFVRFNFSLMACFWPVVYLGQMRGQVGVGLLITSILFGIYLFPGVLMTTVMAGSYLNLRPDRIIGAIRACGAKYLVSVVAFAMAGAVYLSAIGLVNYSFMKMFRAAPFSDLIFGWALGTPMLLLGIYLMHFACWHLGLLYRANHDRFPWILQRHVSSRRTDTLAQLEAARKAAKRHDALRANRPDRDQRVNEIREAEKTKRAPKEEKPIWERVADVRDDT